MEVTITLIVGIVITGILFGVFASIDENSTSLAKRTIRDFAAFFCVLIGMSVATLLVVYPMGYAFDYIFPNMQSNSIDEGEEKDPLRGGGWGN